MRKLLKRDEGFTLIELMVVVLIIGILVAIALPTFLGARTRAQDKAAESNIRNGIAAADTYFTDDDTYTGFDSTTAPNIEPSLTWDDAAVVGDVSVVGTVYVTVAGAGTQVIISATSGSGTEFCLAKDTSASGGQHEGNSVAPATFNVTYAGCDGGW